MSKNRIPRESDLGNEIVEALREFRDDLRSNGGNVSAKYTCRKIILDLQPTVQTPDDVRDVRAVLDVSQAVFAEFLGVDVKTVQAWEQGINKPSKMAVRLLDEIRLSPDHWRKRLSESIRPVEA
ncbi:MAG: hypothetical protein AAF532_02885 [Planctomycetota bacterium]